MSRAATESGALYIYAPLQGEVRIGPEDDDATIFGYLGNVVAGGDFSGDGYGDVLAGPPGNQGGSGGRALVCAGGPRGFQYAKHPIWVGGVWPNIDPIDFGRSACALRIDGSGRDAVGVSAPEYASGQGLLRTYVVRRPRGKAGRETRSVCRTTWDWPPPPTTRCPADAGWADRSSRHMTRTSNIPKANGSI
ncbi:MAG: integrin alpha [Candidatus Eisenbacteria bacterium]